MQLRITFLGDQGQPVLILSELLRSIDENLAHLEGESIKEFGRKFPKYQPPLIQNAFDRFRVSYEKGEFSMLYITEASNGSVIIGMAVKAVAEVILEMTIGEDIKTKWKESSSSKNLQKFLGVELAKFFVRQQPKNLKLAVTKAVAKLKYPSGKPCVALEDMRVTRKGKVETLEVKLKLQEMYDGTHKSYQELVQEYNKIVQQEEDEEVERQMTANQENQLRINQGLSGDT